MRLTKWCIIASAAILTAALTGCYTPHSSTVWTPEKAKAAILKEEGSHIVGTGDITPKSLQVTDEYFDNFYLASTHSTQQYSMITTTQVFRTRKIYFRDIKEVLIWWDALGGTIGPPFVLGVRGPFFYQRKLVFESGEELILSGAPKWEWLNWMWLWVVPVRGFLHSDPYTEAILYMSTRARQSDAKAPSK